MAELSFERYCRWITFWSAAIAAAALVALTPVLLPGRTGLFYALAIGFAASIVNFRISYADLAELGDLASPKAARNTSARSVLRLGIAAAALTVAAWLGGFEAPAILAAAGGLFLTKAVLVVEAVFSLAGGR